MADLEVFEDRFKAAYRRYLDEAATEVDAAEVARVVADASRRVRPGVWPQAIRPAIRPAHAFAWLVLVGLLSVAMGAAVLFVGAQLQPELPAVVPLIGELSTCPPGSTPDQPGPVDQARPVATETVTFDRRAGKLVAVTHGDAGVQTWTFDVCTNTWLQMHPDQEPPNFDWARMVYDTDSDATVLVTAGTAWAYDLGVDTWTGMGVAPAGATPWAYDPRSGLVIAATTTLDEELWTYDMETDTWTPVEGSGPVGGVFAYDASVDRMISYGEETWSFDLRTAARSRSGVETPSIVAGWGWQAPTIAYDEAAERTVVAGNGRLAAYDATADRWEILVPGSPLAYEDGVDPGRDPSCGNLAYDPVNRRLICWDQGANGDDGGVAAFDAVAREWTILLEPGSGQATP
jgi:hypothetical protein